MLDKNGVQASCFFNYRKVYQFMDSSGDSNSLFSKDVGISRKTAAELFGDTEEEQKSFLVESPSSVSSPSPVKPTTTKSKKDRWKEAVRIVSDREKLDNLKTVNEPLASLVSEQLSSGPARAGSIKIKFPNEEEVSEIIFSPTKNNIGCRPDFIPSIVPKIPTMEDEIIIPAPVNVPSGPSGMSGELVEHLVLVVHGVNGSEEYLYRNLEKMKESFEEVRSHWFGKETTASLCHLELINWKSGVIGLQSSLFEKITPRGSLPAESRMFINYAISDVAFYLTPSHCENIKGIVTGLLNERVEQLEKNFPNKFNISGKLTKVTLVGYSLGSVILHDILTASTEDLNFSPFKLFLWGSPLAAYLAVKDREFMIGKFLLPRCVDVYNIYHPHDPVAFRIEPLFYHLDSEIADAEIVPFWKPATTLGWTTVKSLFSSSTGDNDSKPLVPKRRLDYVLQESVTESLSHQYSMLTAHYSYWTSRDVALFMLRRMT